MGLFSKIAAKKPRPPEKSAAASGSKAPAAQHAAPAAPHAGLAAPQPRPKRLSTFAEDAAFSDFEHDDYSNSDRSESRSSDSDSYEEHAHVAVEPHDAHSVSQLSALMGFCGLGTNKESLQALANEESRRTFSLLSGDLKISRLAPTMNKRSRHTYEPAIGDAQVHLIQQVKQRVRGVLAANAAQAPAVHNPLRGNKTLYDRYGTVQDIIGRGAYGVIKFVESPTGHAYAVKELQKRSPAANRGAESADQLVDRVVSEFILSATLNSKNIVRTLDLMLTLPQEKRPGAFYEQLKFCQVMECTSGGDLFSYCKTCISAHSYVSIDEVDCMAKQITKGLWYMHNHGVAHCDLKLENILIVRERGSDPKTRMNLKISDFGKSNAFRTKWDADEQLMPSSSMPIGSQHYIAPEEHVKSASGVSLPKKDCWALGVVIMILFNVRRSYYYDNKGACQLQYYDSELGEADTKTYGSAYLWQTTEPKSAKRYKDAVFDEYVRTRMLSQYSPKTKEWNIQQKGRFIPIETIFDQPDESTDPKSALYHDEDEGFEEDDFAIRKYCIYKLLDMNPAARFTAETLLRSDWLSSVETCGD